MEIDEGPPPFPDLIVDDDDSFAESPEDPEDSEDVKHLPLPNDDFRSLSPAGIQKDSEDVNDKGDTTDVITAIPSEVEKIDKFQEEDDEWGDFGEAAPAPAQKNLDDDDDDWGAFDQARPSTDNRSESESGPDSARSEAARQLAHQQSIEEWGSFENSTTTPGVTAPDDDDEWQAEFTAAPPPPVAVPVENLEFLEKMLDDDSFWDDGFEDDEQQFVEELVVSDFPAVFDSESLLEDVKEFQDEQRRYSSLWLSLRVVEEAISLKFDWKESRIRGNHFKAIKINPNTVKKEPRTAAAAFDTASLLLPTPLQPTSSSASEDHQKTSSPAVESPSIPAADFDWDTSGLTNPMNRANQNSAIIDVDFLSTNGVATSYTSPLQKELEEFGLNLTNGAGNSVASSNILETIMNGRKSPYRNPQVLSLDAQKLLEKLPDLQYLQSEVLMFPVGTNLPH